MFDVHFCQEATRSHLHDKACCFIKGGVMTRELVLRDEIIDTVAPGLAEVHYEANRPIWLGGRTQRRNVIYGKRRGREGSSGVPSANFLSDSFSHTIFMKVRRPVVVGEMCWSQFPETQYQSRT